MEADLALLLNELSDVQSELLSVLEQKQQFMAKSDLEGMQSLQTQEEELCQRLDSCHQQRGEMLHQAQGRGVTAENLQELIHTLPASIASPLTEQATDASQRMRLLQHQSLTNWVLAQRSLLHISQLLEIVATGGRQQPTYGDGDSSLNRGSLVDRAV